MDKYFQDYTVALVSELKAISPPSYVPPDDGAKPKTEMVLARSLVSNTRGYIERVVAQINGTYENGWYDGCAVMIRRLLETLIVEVFVEMSRNVQSGNTQNLKSMVIQRSFPKWSVAERRKTAAASD